MKEVKVMPKFKCDFCKRRSIESAMIRHEKICYRNPNRFCDTCKNTGELEGEYIPGVGTTPAHPCPFCSRFDAKQLEEIESRERDENTPLM